MKYLFIILSLLIIEKVSISQTVIKMKKEGGVYTMPCKVNGLKLSFIFDTGASDVSIGLTEALFMLKNEYLSLNDIKDSVKYRIANGDITEGTIINLQEVIIGDIVLNDIKASVIHNINSPLLLGQSALRKLGKIEFNYSNNTLIINNNSLKTVPIENTNMGENIIKGDKYILNKSKVDSALFYYDKAVKNGNINAYYKIAQAYYLGYPSYTTKEKKGARKNIIDYYEAGAKQGCIYACYTLGVKYYLGKKDLPTTWLGIKRNLDYSIFYLSYAAKKGHKNAKSLLQHIKYYRLIKREQKARTSAILIGMGRGAKGQPVNAQELDYAKIIKYRRATYPNYSQVLFEKKKYYNQKFNQLDNIAKDKSLHWYKRYFALQDQGLIITILDEIDWLIKKSN